MDLDILGTGTCYLFDEKKLPVEKCFNITKKSVMLELQLDKKLRSLHVAYLNPKLKNHSSYGENYFKNHQVVAAEMLRADVLTFIKEESRLMPNTLFVLDCAPGLSEFEQKLLKECYHLTVGGKLKVQEEYVTTLDSAHVRKCIQCLNDSCQGLEVKKDLRSIRLILNDVQNYSGYLRGEGNDVEQRWKRIATEVKSVLVNKGIKVYFWGYSESIAMRTTYTDELKVENQIDEYIFTDNNFIKM